MHRPDLSCVSVAIGQEADSETKKWFPHVERGIVSGIAVLHEHYERLLVQSLIEIPHIYSHPIDTTAAGCERFGRSWAVEFGRSDSVRPLEADGPD